MVGSTQGVGKEGSPEARARGSMSGVRRRPGRLGGNGWRKASQTLHPVSVTPTQISEPQDALGIGQLCSGLPQNRQDAWCLSLRSQLLSL